MISRAWMIIPASDATSAMISFRRASCGGVSTGRRYFGHHTRWYLRLKVAPALRRYRDMPPIIQQPLVSPQPSGTAVFLHRLKANVPAELIYGCLVSVLDR